MVTVPALVWRGGPLQQGLTVGVSVGLFFGLLAWLDSGMMLSGAIVFVVLGVGTGFWMSRRMARYWPRAGELTGTQRVTVAAVVRRGTRIQDPDLIPAVLDYSRGLHAAAATGRSWRWLLVVVLAAAVVMALWDAVTGSMGNLIASVIYLVLIGVEMSWWPHRLTELLANADRAAAATGQVGISD